MFPLLLPLRLTRSSWEISNRTSEFLFLGLALVLALALSELQSDKFAVLARRITRGAVLRVGTPLVFAAIATILFIGGVVAGWPSNGRLQHPFFFTYHGQAVFPQGYAAADWMRTFLGENNRIAADYSNARYLVAYGNQYPLSGNARGIPEILNARQLDRGVLEILAFNRVQYVLIDRRLIRDDPFLGIFFDENFERSSQRGKYFDADVYRKFDEDQRAQRLFDSGEVLIYQVEGLSGYSPSK
jgi:hypothetical protein